MADLQTEEYDINIPIGMGMPTDEVTASPTLEDYLFRIRSDLEAINAELIAATDALAALTAATDPYTPTNVTTDRSFDADSTTVDELADVLGTLIADLQAKDIIS